MMRRAVFSIARATPSRAPMAARPFSIVAQRRCTCPFSGRRGSSQSISPASVTAVGSSELLLMHCHSRRQDARVGRGQHWCQEVRGYVDTALGLGDLSPVA